MKAASTQQKNAKPLKTAKQSRNNVTELSVYLAERLGEHFSKSWTNVLTRHRELP